MAKANGKKSGTVDAPRHTRKKNLQPRGFPLSAEERYERVARRAYALYEERGQAHGGDLDDWLTAERLVQEELRQGSLREELVAE
jgi:hypothetical protein